MIKTIFGYMLIGSGVALSVSIVLAAIYEAFAVPVGVPLISNIVIPFVNRHNVIASLIVGAIVGFITFLIVHFFGART